MAKVHALSIVDPKAELADDVEVGPFCIVESDVVIGAGSKLESHVVIKSGTSLGSNNILAQGVVLGGDPQDRKYQGEPTFLKIGDGNMIREYVTIHRATGEGRSTVIGNDCYIMAYSHFGHNCVVHDHVTVANLAAVSGHVTIEELVTIGGMVGIHQWVRVGKVAMVGGFTKLTRDVPPFMMVEGPDELLRDINAVGLRRIGVESKDRLALHKAAKLLFKSQLGLRNALEIVRREVPMTPEVLALLAFEERRFKGKNGRGDQP